MARAILSILLVFSFLSHADEIQQTCDTQTLPPSQHFDGDGYTIRFVRWHSGVAASGSPYIYSLMSIEEGAERREVHTISYYPDANEFYIQGVLSSGPVGTEIDRQRILRRRGSRLSPRGYALRRSNIVTVRQTEDSLVFEHKANPKGRLIVKISIEDILGDYDNDGGCSVAQYTDSSDEQSDLDDTIPDYQYTGETQEEIAQQLQQEQEALQGADETIEMYEEY